MDLCISEKIIIHKKIKTFSFLISCLQCLLKIESCLHSKHYQVCLRLPHSHPGLAFVQWYMDSEKARESNSYRHREGN